MAPTTEQEEILNKHVNLYFSSHHDKSRWNGEGENGGAEWHTNKAIAADIYKAMDEYAKQQVIAFIKDSIQKRILHPTTDETICIDGIEVGSRKFDLAVSHFYGKFVENHAVEFGKWLNENCDHWGDEVLYANGDGKSYSVEDIYNKYIIEQQNKP